MNMEPERMDTLISDFAKTLEETQSEVHGLASVAYTDADDYMTRRTLIDPEIPEDVFIDIFASFFWVYIAEAGLDAEQTAGLIDRILATAVEAVSLQEEPPEEAAPTTEFRMMAQDFMEQLRGTFGDVKSLAAIVWNDTLGDLVCSTRCTEAITADELSEVLAAFVVSLVASGQLSRKEAKEIFAQAAARADDQYDGLQEYIKVDNPQE